MSFYKTFQVTLETKNEIKLREGHSFKSKFVLTCVRGKGDKLKVTVEHFAFRKNKWQSYSITNESDKVQKFTDDQINQAWLGAVQAGIIPSTVELATPMFPEEQVKKALAFGAWYEMVQERFLTNDLGEYVDVNGEVVTEENKVSMDEDEQQWYFVNNVTLNDITII